MTYQELHSTLTTRTDLTDLICYDVYAMEFLEGYVTYSYNVDGERVSLDITQLKSDIEILRRDVASTRYTAADAPSAATVASAITTAQSSLAHNRTIVAKDNQAANQLLAQANGYASQAHVTCKF